MAFGQALGGKMPQDGGKVSPENDIAALKEIYLYFSGG